MWSRLVRQRAATGTQAHRTGTPYRHTGQRVRVQGHSRGSGPEAKHTPKAGNRSSLALRVLASYKEWERDIGSLPYRKKQGPVDTRYFQFACGHPVAVVLPLAILEVTQILTMRHDS